MNDFSVLRIIGRGGFGEVYGCRKVDTGKMYAMKCLDKKRIKMKQGETLALNERTMLSLVSTGEDCPFIVCMTYAFHTPSKLCFILDLMNGGDLHYHLSQHGVFNETNMKFYATEIILGLEHMHRRYALLFIYFSLCIVRSREDLSFPCSKRLRRKFYRSGSLRVLSYPRH